MYIWLGLERGSGRANRTYFIHLPMKMEPIVSSETSAIRIQTPGNYPKMNKLQINKLLPSERQRLMQKTLKRVKYKETDIHNVVTRINLNWLRN